MNQAHKALAWCWEPSKYSVGCYLQGKICLYQRGLLLEKNHDSRQRGDFEGFEQGEPTQVCACGEAPRPAPTAIGGAVPFATELELGR